MTEFKKILFPSDLEESSAKILPFVLSTAEKWDSEIYILYVVDDPLKWDGMYEMAYPSLSNLQEEALKAAKKALDKVCRNTLNGCPNFHRMVASGNTTSEILKAIQTEGIDMVIMGTHGSNWFGRTLFGSVAENVVKKSPVPVLVVNPNKIS